MTRTTPRNEMLTQIIERDIEETYREFVRKSIERDKNTDGFKEMVKRRQAAIDRQAALGLPTTENPNEEWKSLEN